MTARRWATFPRILPRNRALERGWGRKSVFPARQWAKRTWPL